MTLEVIEQAPLDERVKDEVDAAYAAAGFVDEDGERNMAAVEEKTLGIVKPAVVTKRAERGKVAVLRHKIVSEVFPNVPGPELWAEQNDPEVAKGVYTQLDGAIWRLLDPGSSGKIQNRLDGAGLLCRTQATPSGEWAVYVTKDLSCLLEDFTGPSKTAVKKMVDKFARNLVMATDRLPEFGPKFEKELSSAATKALESGLVILTPALVAAAAETDETDDEA